MPERICWTLAAWEDYQYWQRQDRKTLRRVNTLIQDCLRNPHSGIGKPDPFQAFANCKSDLVARCERQASNEYLHRNNAQKYDLNIHDYNHNYNGH